MKRLLTTASINNSGLNSKCYKKMHHEEPHNHFKLSKHVHTRKAAVGNLAEVLLLQPVADEISLTRRSGSRMLIYTQVIGRRRSS